jgi:hypothetical protein
MITNAVMIRAMTARHFRLAIRMNQPKNLE